MNGLWRIMGCVLLLGACGGRSNQDSPPVEDGSGDELASGGTISSGGATASGGSAETSGGASTSLATACPGDPGPDPIPGATCSTQIQTCMNDRAQPDSCAFSALSVSIAELATDCSVYCGSMSVGMRSGCVVALNVSHLGIVQPQTSEAAEACLKQRLIGTRWDCAADQDGWISIYLGSCTVAR